MSRKKREYRTHSRENYDRFMRENKLTEAELPFSKYVKVLNVNNWMYVEYALTTGSKIKLPFGFGELAVNKKMLKRFKIHDGKTYVNLRIDWAKTKKEKKRIYHTNEHSDGFNYSWVWLKKNAKLYLSDLYVFKPCRYASRAIAKYINKANSQYKQMYLEWKK